MAGQSEVIDRVLVTGHDGYIGHVLVGHLDREGYGVVGLDSYLFEGCDFGRTRPLEQVIRKDVRDVTAEDLTGVHAIIHLGGVSNDPIGQLSPTSTYGINYAASVELARLAKDAGVRRFVFASSCSVYGRSGAACVDERSSPDPLTAYARSKLLVEQALPGLADDSFSPIVLRNATAYGGSPKLRVDLVVNNLVGAAVTAGEVRLLSDGAAWRPLAHVDDISSACIAVLRADRDAVHGEIFNVGSNGGNHRISEVADVVADVVQGSRVTRPDHPDRDARSYRVGFEKLAAKVPAYRPTRTLHDGVAELAASFAGARLTYDAFVSSRYHRLKRVRELIDGGRIDEHLRWQ